MNASLRNCAMAVAAALLIFTSARPSTAQSPYRALENDMSVLSTSEAALARRINHDRIRHDLPPLNLDPRLSEVARLFSRDMSEHGYIEDYSPRLGTVRYQARRAGVSVPDILYILLQLPNLDNFMDHISEGDRPLHLQDLSHIGIGVSKTYRGHHVTIILAKSRSRLEEFPSMAQPGDTHTLRWRLADEYTEPKVFLSEPDEDIVEIDIANAGRHGYSADVTFPEQGEYTLQISAQGELGTQITDVMKIYAGVPYPQPEKMDRVEEHVDDIRQAETTMLEMVNRERTQRSLKPLKQNERLAEVARGHSADMIDHNYFAHVSPVRGDLAARIRNAGLNLMGFGENLARNRSINGAHQSLMNSPQHRLNILNEDFVELGIGVELDKSGIFYVTQVFGTPFQKHTPEHVAENLLKEINESRREDGLAALRQVDRLDSIARQNSDKMLQMGELTASKARGLLDDSRGAHGYRYTLTQVIMITGMPGGEHFQLPANADPKRFSRIGIGVVEEEASATTPPLFWITVIYAGG